MKIKAAEIRDIIRQQIRDYDREIDVSETGTVLSVGDGIARVYGLDNAMAGELLEFPHGVRGTSSATAPEHAATHTTAAILVRVFFEVAIH